MTGVTCGKVFREKLFSVVHDGDLGLTNVPNSPHHKLSSWLRRKVSGAKKLGRLSWAWRAILSSDLQAAMWLVWWLRVLRQDCDAVYSQQFFILGILLHKMTKLDVRRRPTHWLKSVELSDEVPYAEQAVGTSYMDGRRLIWFACISVW